MKINTLIKDLKEETISLNEVSTFYRYELINHFLHQCKVDNKLKAIICELDDWLLEFQAELPECDEYFSANSAPVRKETYGIVNN